MNRLVLIDGNAILHRAYHALPPLTSPDGAVVNAVYGFTTILIRLIRDLQPTHVAVAFDRPAPTFRKKLYKEYQAKRPKMDDDLIPQVDKIHTLLETFGIPIFEKDGYEADDILGTLSHSVIPATEPESSIQKSKQDSRRSLSRRMSRRDDNTIEQAIIVTGDKDILQLVKDDTVLVYMPTKGLSEGKLYGEKETEERIGVPPALIPDYKALAGDASDNYPGIQGIGPKTAVEILKKAGSVDRLYKQINTKTFGLSEAVVSRIKEGKEDALLSHTLATIHTDVPVEITIPEFTESQLASKQAIDELTRLGFRSLVKRLSGVEGKRDKDSKMQSDKDKKSKTEDQIGLF